MKCTEDKDRLGHDPIASVCREMRETADANERLGFHDLRNLSTDSLRAWADIVEETSKNAKGGRRRPCLAMPSELKPCPFCGQRAEVGCCFDGAESIGFVCCENAGCDARIRIACDVRSASPKEMMEQAIAAWNRRAAIKKDANNG